MFTFSFHWKMIFLCVITILLLKTVLTIIIILKIHNSTFDKSVASKTSRLINKCICSNEIITCLKIDR